MPTPPALVTRTITTLTAASLLAGCVFGGNGTHEAFGDGDLPLEQRQPIEQYIDTVVPVS